MCWRAPLHISCMAVSTGCVAHSSAVLPAMSGGLRGGAQPSTASLLADKRNGKATVRLQHILNSHAPLSFFVALYRSCTCRRLQLIGKQQRNQSTAHCEETVGKPSVILGGGPCGGSLRICFLGLAIHTHFYCSHKRPALCAPTCNLKDCNLVQSPVLG